MEDAKYEIKNRKLNKSQLYKEDNEDEPEIPVTGYEYDKYKTEATIFLKGCLNAKKLSKLSEKVKKSE